MVPFTSLHLISHLFLHPITDRVQVETKAFVAMKACDLVMVHGRVIVKILATKRAPGGRETRREGTAICRPYQRKKSGHGGNLTSSYQFFLTSPPSPPPI